MKFKIRIEGELDGGEIVVRTPLEVEIETDDPNTPDEKPEKTNVKPIIKAVNQ